jgi:hypothetical protein
MAQHVYRCVCCYFARLEGSFVLSYRVMALTCSRLNSYPLFVRSYNDRTVRTALHFGDLGQSS